MHISLIEYSMSNIAISYSHVGLQTDSTVIYLFPTSLNVIVSACILQHALLKIKSNQHSEEFQL